jgi:hypothetical protein
MQNIERADSRRTFLVQLSAICAGCGLPLPFLPSQAQEFLETEPDASAYKKPCARCATCQARFCRYR